MVKKDGMILENLLLILSETDIIYLIMWAIKAILIIMWCNQNEYNEQRGTTKDWSFPFLRLEAIVSGVSAISDFPIHYRLAVIGGEEGLEDDANAKILAVL